jgi:hypothetical protein
MTDPETHQESDQPIEEAYDRLATALAPPPDVANRVERRLVARRRTRRVGVVGAAGLVAAAAVGGAVLLGSGDDGASVVATDEPAATGSFVLTRPDGSTFELSDLTLSCEPPLEAGTDGLKGPQRIWLSSPRDMGPDGESPQQPFLLFEGIVDKVDGRTFQLPYNSDDGDSDSRPFVLFALDPEVTSSEARANEVSSAEEGAAGSVVVTRASCDPVPVLELVVDGDLGSEVSLESLHVSGSFG